jgi:putative transposase
MLYDTDLSDGQYALINQYLPKVKSTKPCKYTKHQFLNAILYVKKTGCQWRMLPKDYPPFRTVHKYFRKLCVLGVLENIVFQLNNRVIKKISKVRNNNTLKLIIDSKSVDCSERLCGKYSDYDGHKKVKGMKLFELIDCNNLSWRSMLFPANTAEIKGAKTIISRTFESQTKPIVKFILGDKAFNGEGFEKEVYAKYGITIVSLKKKQNRKFNLPEDEAKHVRIEKEKYDFITPHRYRVEQNFAHHMQDRRLTRIYDYYPKSYEGYVKLAHIVRSIRKLGI